MNHESSPSTILTQQKNKINLLDLPPELQLEIFHDCEKLTSPICKSLLSYTRAPIFRIVTIKSIKLFNFFIHTIFNDPSAGSLVEVLRVKIDENEDEETITVHPIQVVDVLKHLTQVDRFEINWEWLATIFSSRPASYSTLPRLETLILTDPFRSQDQPWNIIHFADLAQRRNLTYLSLSSNVDIEVTGEFIGLENTFLAEGRSPEQKQKELIKKRKQIDKLKRSLRLIAALHPNYESDESETFQTESLDVRTSIIDIDLLITISYFISSLALQISDYLVDKGLLKLLEELPYLYALEIYDDFGRRTVTTTEYPNPVISIYPIITQFKELEFFRISARVFTPELFQYLRDPLPLGDLAFGSRTNVKISDLMQLLLPGPAKLSALRFLTLDVVYAEAAKHRVETDGLYFDEDEGIHTLYPEWYLARWTEDFSEEGLKELIKLGKEQGVEIVGTSVNAIGVKKAFYDELDLVNQLVQEMEIDSNDSIDDE